MCVDPDLFGLAESFGKAFCNSRWIGADGSCADAHKIDLVKRGKSVHELHDLFIGQSENIAAGKKDVANRGMRLHVADAGLQVRGSLDDFGFAEEALARAMAAIHEATVGRHDENAVGKALLEAFNFGGVREFAKGIDRKFGILPRQFFRGGVGIDLTCEARGKCRKTLRIGARVNREFSLH